MTTLLKIGPTDCGRRLSLDEFLSARGQEGFHYELIGGKLSVSPLPNAPMWRVERWIRDKLDAYVREHPEVINLVDSKTRVFLPEAAEVTAPEPDVSAYHDFPLHLPPPELDWEELNPLLVVEVLSESDPNKDLVRNVDLYLQVPSIRQYWILDARADGIRPTLLVYRRRDRRRWLKVLAVAPGATFTTDLLPGFSLVLDTRT